MQPSSEIPPDVVDLAENTPTEMRNIHMPMIHDLEGDGNQIACSGVTQAGRGKRKASAKQSADATVKASGSDNLSSSELKNKPLKAMKQEKK